MLVNRIEKHKNLSINETEKGKQKTAYSKTDVLVQTFR